MFQCLALGYGRGKVFEAGVGVLRLVRSVSEQVSGPGSSPSTPSLPGHEVSVVLL